MNITTKKIVLTWLNKSLIGWFVDLFLFFFKKWPRFVWQRRFRFCGLNACEFLFICAWTQLSVTRLKIVTETSMRHWYLKISWKNVPCNRARNQISQCVPAQSRSAQVQTCPGECAATARLWMSKTGLRSVYGGPWAPRGEPKLNKYLLHPVCIKGLHTWLWRQSDIKQGGAAQPAPAGVRAHIYDLPYLALKITLFTHSSTISIVCFFKTIYSVVFTSSYVVIYWSLCVFSIFIFFFGSSGCKKKTVSFRTARQV